jgi:hypothetical protein
MKVRRPRIDNGAGFGPTYNTGLLDVSASKFRTAQVKLGEIRSVACGDSLGIIGSCGVGEDVLCPMQPPSSAMTPSISHKVWPAVTGLAAASNLLWLGPRSRKL